ncbi:class I SAM-dependent methyltransferase [Thermoflexibacter ruber]|uniref:Methyltransferase domain-containing protein n=1 Tax=Thermoflexibacter ruber TaxID=1003 RepID=A0A1I2GN94_9BACT|nr:class I SAM-dependent methyltransferase [Thermoflexibacter ruber]SFF18156.1 Methyltransferase domain-containing protein [Thermoflexibacter ruber]
MNCRFDNLSLTHVFVDLGFSPPSNSFLSASQLNEPEVYYPLKLYVSERTFLVQIDEYKKANEIFSQEYVYFSSYSSFWLAHCKSYTEMIMKRFELNAASQVIEIASNDGYLLQYFKEKNIPVLGIEPTLSTAQVAQRKGIPTWIEFFGTDLAKKIVAENKQADLLIGNNVLAHVPNLNDFVAGLKIALKPKGIVTMEFPHLMQLNENNQFDTIYHEHFSYFSFLTVKQIFEKHGLTLFEVEEIPTHGGSLRIYAKHAENNDLPCSKNVDNLLAKEIAKGMNTLAYYQGFQQKVDKIKYDFLSFLLEQKKLGKKVAGYGAAAKGNTLLNYCGIKKDLISFVADKSPYKQGKYLPGSHIPVVSEEELKAEKPDFVVIFPWNIQKEIEEQLSYIRSWNGKFVVAIPELKIW